MDYEKLGKRLKDFRKKSKMTQEQLSYDIGYSVPHISHVENAKTTLSVDFLVKACNALRVSTDQLLKDSLDHVEDLYHVEIMKELADCSLSELKFIRQALVDIKRNLRENLDLRNEDID